MPTPASKEEHKRERGEKRSRKIVIVAAERKGQIENQDGSFNGSLMELLGECAFISHHPK